MHCSSKLIVAQRNDTVDKTPFVKRLKREQLLLSSLPTEIICEILGHLEIQDIARISQTCSSIHSFILNAMKKISISIKSTNKECWNCVKK